MTPAVLSPDRCFGPDPARRDLARELHARVADAPIVSPHGHVDPRLLADPQATLGTPVDLLVIPDHYVLRMLYSQGVLLRTWACARATAGPSRPTTGGSGSASPSASTFRGTPSGTGWARLAEEPLTPESAQRVYDRLEQSLARPEFALARSPSASAWKSCAPRTAPPTPRAPPLAQWTRAGAAGCAPPSGPTRW